MIADSLSGLLFKNKRDRKMVCVDPKVCGHLCAYVNAGNLSFSCIICYPFASPSLQLMQCYASIHNNLVMEGIKPYIQSTTVLSESMCTKYVERESPLFGLGLHICVFGFAQLLSFGFASPSLH